MSSHRLKNVFSGSLCCCFGAASVFLTVLTGDASRAGAAGRGAVLVTITDGAVAGSGAGPGAGLAATTGSRLNFAGGSAWGGGSFVRRGIFRHRPGYRSRDSEIVCCLGHFSCRCGFDRAWNGGRRRLFVERNDFRHGARFGTAFLQFQRFRILVKRRRMVVNDFRAKTCGKLFDARLRGCAQFVKTRPRRRCFAPGVIWQAFGWPARKTAAQALLPALAHGPVAHLPARMTDLLYRRGS